MPEKPKNENDKENKAENPREIESEIGGDDSPSSDKKEKSYYYDDAYGYEIYQADEDDETENC